MPRGDRNQWTGVTTEDRFWRCTDKRGQDECWPWNGERVVGGYGRLQVAGFGIKTGNFKRVLAHRFSYELHNGKIPDGLTIDHLCRNPWCVNPAHLEAVSMRENIMRGNGACAQRHRERLAREAEHSGENRVMATSPSAPATPEERALDALRKGQA